LRFRGERRTQTSNKRMPQGIQWLFSWGDLFPYTKTEMTYQEISVRVELNAERSTKPVLARCS
jgi:hypothetical protein